MSTANGAVSIHLDEQGQVHASGPFNRDWNTRMRTLAGRWEPASKSWVFDGRDEARVRALAREIFGQDGTEDPEDVVTVQVPAHPNSGLSRLIVAGRIVAERKTRDEPVRLAAGVAIVSGSFPETAGSEKYPQLGGDAVLEIRDIPRAAASAAGAPVVGDAQKKAALEAERARLQARLAQIEDELIALCRIAPTSGSDLKG